MRLTHLWRCQYSELLDQIPVAYAICYLFGTIGTGMILAYVGPKLLGIDLEEACKILNKKMSEGTPEEGIARSLASPEVSYL
ncbi:hypothetical protein O9993_06855 [Vibrio lentus]|nr:hypothetical protein [Vibrio lentus]